jgi:hypothetical protein
LVTFVNIKTLFPSEVISEDFVIEIVPLTLLQAIVGFGDPSVVHVKVTFVPCNTVLVLGVLVIETLGTTTMNETEDLLK